MTISAISARRYVMDSSSSVFSDDAGGRLELDTHADTCVAGANTMVLDLTGKTVSVTPFCESEYEAIDEIPVATVATAYDCPNTGKVYVLVINEALYFGERMNHSLLCPNQLRANGVRVDDCPKQFDENSLHSIYVPEHDLTIPLELRGVISGITTRLPTEAELEDLTMHVPLTSELEWDPHASAFASNEPEHDFACANMGNYRATSECNSFKLFDCYRSLELQLSGDGQWLARRLVAMVKASLPMGTRMVEAVVRGETTSVVNPETLSRLWLVGMETARDTLRVTTQLGVRTIKHPAQRRFRTALPHLRYPHLKGTCYADTLFFNLKSVRGFNCAHVIGNGIGFTRFYPMVSKADAHLSLKTFIQDVGIMEHPPCSRWRSYNGLQGVEKDNTRVSNKTNYNGTVFSVAKSG